MSPETEAELPTPLPADRPRAATVRSRVMLEVAAALVAEQGWDAKQARVSLRPQGSADWELSLFASDGIDGVAEVATGASQFAILNPATAIRRAWEHVTGNSDPQVAAIATIPSHDQLGLATASATALASVEEIADLKPPLRISMRGGRPNHSVHLVVDDVFRAAGFTLADVRAWGGEIRYQDGHVHGEIRSVSMREAEVDLMVDEGIYNWVDLALGAGFSFLRLEDETLDRLELQGYRRSMLDRRRYPRLVRDVAVVDFSGFLIYTHQSTSDDLVSAFCRALLASADRIPWQGGPALPLPRMVIDVVDAPLPIPLHPAAARFWDDHDLGEVRD